MSLLSSFLHFCVRRREVFHFWTTRQILQNCKVRSLYKQRELYYISGGPLGLSVVSSVGVTISRESSWIYIFFSSIIVSLSFIFPIGFLLTNSCSFPTPTLLEYSRATCLLYFLWSSMSEKFFHPKTTRIKLLKTVERQGCDTAISGSKSRDVSLIRHVTRRLSRFTGMPYA